MKSEFVNRIEEMVGEEPFYSSEYPEDLPNVEEAFQTFMSENGFSHGFSIVQKPNTEIDDDGYVVRYATITVPSEGVIVTASANLHSGEWEFFFDRIKEIA